MKTTSPNKAGEILIKIKNLKQEIIEWEKQIHFIQHTWNNEDMRHELITLTFYLYYVPGVVINP